MTAALILLTVLGTGGWAAGVSKVILADGTAIEATRIEPGSEGLTVFVGEQKRALTWEDLEAETAYRYRLSVTEPKGPAYLSLAEFCHRRGLVRESFAALSRATELAPELRERVEGLRAEYEASARTDRVVVGGAALPGAAGDPEQVLVEQRGRAEIAGKLLLRKFSTRETVHFIVHTTVPDRLGNSIDDLVEKGVYERLSKVLNVPEGRFGWKGKVVVYVLGDGRELSEFALKAHSFPGQAAAYFRAVEGQAELVLSRGTGEDRFKQDLTHEMTHLMVHYYVYPHRAPNWLQEGLAQSAEFEALPRAAARKESIDIIRRDLAGGAMMKLTELVGVDRPRSPSDLSGYAYAWSFVDYVKARRPAVLTAFLGLLKEGADPDEAFRQAFGADRAALEAAWVDYVRSTY